MAWNIRWYLCATWVYGGRDSCSQNLQTLVSQCLFAPGNPISIPSPIDFNWDNWGWQSKAFGWEVGALLWKLLESLWAAESKARAARPPHSCCCGCCWSSSFQRETFPSAGLWFFLYFFSTLFVGLGKISSFCVPYSKDSVLKKHNEDWRIQFANLVICVMIKMVLDQVLDLQGYNRGFLILLCLNAWRSLQC